MKLKITIDGKTYEADVDVAEPRPPQPGWVAPIGQARVAATPVTPPITPTGPTIAADETKVCRSPFAGTVSKVAAQSGQVIQINDVLVVLEAMKMETVITAPRAGRIEKISVSVGDAVQGGQILVEFA